MLRQLILAITQEVAVTITKFHHPTITKDTEKVQLKQKGSPRKVLEKPSLLQTDIINQMTAKTATKTEVAHLVITNKNEDVLVINANKIVIETGLLQIIHTDHTHQGKTNTNHPEIDTNHQDGIIATNHLEEIPDINHLDEITTDHLIEIIDPLNIAQAPLTTVHAKMIASHPEEITKVRLTDHHQQTKDNNINQVPIGNNHLTDQDHHINNKATDTVPHHLTDSLTDIKVLQETADKDLHIAQTTDKDQEVQGQDHFME